MHTVLRQTSKHPHSPQTMSQRPSCPLQADTASLQDLVARNVLKTATAAELKDIYIRLAADFENFRRRSATDLGNAKNMALTSVLKDMVVVLDNFELASKNVATSTEKEESIKRSYDALGTQLTNTLTKLGVEAIDPLGLDFDPMFHDGIQQAESTEYAEGKVCKALQRGYKVRICTSVRLSFARFVLHFCAQRRHACASC